MVTVTDYTPQNLSGLTGRCNATLANCKHPTCDYHYGKASQLIECPECGTPREKCSKWPVKGRAECDLHGGATAIGAAAPNYAGKGLSQSLPTRFLDKFQAYYQDPDVLNMQADIALLQMRRDSLVAQIAASPVAAAQWEELKNRFEDLSYHIEVGHTNKITEAMWALGRIIAAGYNDVLIWREVGHTIEQARKVRDSEIRRRKLADTNISEQRFDRILGFIMSVIQNRVKDETTKQAIMRDLESLNV